MKLLSTSRLILQAGHLDLLARLPEVLVDEASPREPLTTTDGHRVLQMAIAS